MINTYLTSNFSVDLKLPQCKIDTRALIKRFVIESDRRIVINLLFNPHVYNKLLGHGGLARPEITLTQYNSDGSIAYMLEFENVVRADLSDLVYDYSANEILEYAVTFRFSKINVV